MQLLETIEIRGSHPGRIELSQGDLTDLSSRQRADLLLVSAFPDDYEPTPGSLIGALHGKGLSVKKLARHKDIDLRTMNRTDFGGDSIALKEDGVHDRHQRSPKLASLSS